MKYDDNTTHITTNPIHLIIIFLSIIISNVTRFESGNLEKAVRITDTYYELYLRFVQFSFTLNIEIIQNLITISSLDLTFTQHVTASGFTSR